MYCPHIAQFIHDEDPCAVACVQHRFAERMVRTSDTVKPCFSYLATSAFFSPPKGGRPEDTVIMMNACPPQLHCLSVDPYSVFYIDRKRTYSKKIFCYVNDISVFLYCIWQILIDELILREELLFKYDR